MWFKAVERATSKLSRMRIRLHAVIRIRHKFAAFLALIMLASLVLLFPAADEFSFGAMNMETAMATPVDSSLSWSIRGFNFQSWWHDDYLSPSSAASLERIAGTGANWVTVGPTQYMENAQSVSIAPEANGRTATDAAIARAIDDAHARGLKVLFKPHIDVRDDTWRGDIRPADPTAWFESYSQMITRYAQLAQAHGVEIMAIGTELSSMVKADHYGDWANIISQIRFAYHGQITYAASQNDLENPATVSFSGLLDYLGADLYFPLSDLSDPSVDDLVRGWTEYNGTYGRFNWVAEIEAWQAYWDKPVIFTEMGYRSVKFGTASPWDYSFAGVYDGDLQARAYEAAFRVFGNKPWLVGVLWWNWSVTDSGGFTDTNYTIINKPAEAVISNWFANGANAQPSLTVESGIVSWTSYADYRERLLHVTYQVNNNGGMARQVSVIGGTAGNGVTLASELPADVGDIPQGSSSSYSAIYRIPQGITDFLAVPYITYIDTAGTTHNLPVAPVGLEG
ncbi:MAG: hypothetical protein WC828_03655 [Thermoleophilia bacterium]